MTESRRYLRALRNAVPRSFRRRVVAEIRNHLAEAIAAERARGLDRDEAERLTIERLGPPEHLAAQFPADTPRPEARLAAPTRSRRTVTIVAGLAALAVVAAVAGLAVVHTQRPPAPPARRAADKATLPSGIVALPASTATPLQVAVGRRMTPEAQNIGTIVLQLARIVQRRIVLNPRSGRSVTLPSR